MAGSEITTAPEDTRGRSRNLRPLVALIPYIRRYQRTLVLAMVALIVAAGAMLALPIAVRHVIDHGFTAGMSGSELAALDRYFLVLFVLSAALGGFAALRSYLVSYLGEHVVADLRNDIYQHVITLSPAFFEQRRTGEVLSRLTTDTTLVQSIAGVNLSITLRSAVTLIGGLIMLVATSPRLTMVIVALIPLVLVPLFVFGRRVRRLSRETQDRVADTSGIAGETLGAIQTVQAFTLEGEQSARFAKAVARSLESAMARIRARSWLTAMAVFIVFGAIVFVLWLGARAVIAGTMTPGELGQFLLFALMVAGASAGLSEMWGEMQRAAGAVERLMELLHEPLALAVPKAPTELGETRGHLAFSDVRFSYPTRAHEFALERFSLEVAPGETVALVGPSGAGKTTVFQLLLRFYDLNAGVIAVDGVDIAKADPKLVRSRIGIVPQETVVFADSARENIRCGRPGASDAEVQAAAEVAGAHEFIAKLPDGYDSNLGERGIRLSGGQRQRIAIARAILKDAPIILLDEATSSLDAESERAVQRGLEALMRDRTTLVIAHRLATVQRADRIAVMDEGRIISVGTHQELVAADGLYARLAALQFAA